MIWPPDYKAEYIRRYKLYDLIENDIEARAMAFELWRRSPKDFINDCCITYNPRAQELKRMPFLTFPRQNDLCDFIVGCWQDKEDGLLEKSRDMGATWLCSALSVWMWRFVPESAIGWGSRKEDLVDELGNPDSIFEKIRIIIRNMPKVLRPAGFDMQKHMPFMKITNPENGSIIAGESGDNIGRGGRSSIYFKDEAAHYERPELIEAALGDNTDVQIDISSVNGPNNVFARRRHGGEVWYKNKPATPGKTRVFIMDWREHPGKDQAWYDRRRKKAEDDGLLHKFAQEVDRDYNASLDRVIIPIAWIKSAIDAHIKLGIPDSGEKRAGLDVADEGGDKNALAICKGVILTYSEAWGEGDTGVTARRAVDECKLKSVRYLYYDSIGVGAGVKAETNRLRDIGQVDDNLIISPWNAAASPTNAEEHLIPYDSQSPLNKDFFSNLKAQAWWMLRMRFERTYKAINHGATYDPSELISLSSEIESLQELVSELAGATVKHNNAGKLVVDKKPEGGRSPNRADSVVIVFHPTRETSSFDYA